ncbi:MAG: HlyD family efflux transporter periplasmic adaptor subunit [Pseudomonadota bacterium]
MDNLPLEPPQERPTKKSPVQRIMNRAVYLPMIFGLIFLGGFLGLYFQPPGLRLVYEWTGLEPGAGSSSPIAVSPDVAEAIESQQLDIAATDVVALGKIQPAEDVVTIAMPFGANDAAISTVEVAEGDTVERGDIVAILDNQPTLEADVDAAQATVSVREAALVQTREATASSRNEAFATLERARAEAKNAEDELARAQTLFERGIVTRANLDRAQTTKDQAEREVDRAQAVFDRYETVDLEQQSDVIVAMRNLEAANAELERTNRNLQRAFVRAPTAGTILEINVRPGEKPGTEGVATLGNLSQMKAVLEVYQTDIGRVTLGQQVTLTATALSEPLSGAVSDIGLRVGRQTILDDDPVANTDARVITVEVALDDASTAAAARYTDLEVVARIDASGAPR